MRYLEITAFKISKFKFRISAFFSLFKIFFEREERRDEKPAL